jgi:hypothetical protein
MAIMLDLETLGFRPETVVLTIGAVHFDPYDINKEPDKPFYARLDMEEQTALGRTTDESTIEWWGKQPQSAQDEAMSEENRISLADFKQQLNKYIVGVDKIWANGPTFDIIILENLYRMIGAPVPWQFWQVRDARTIYDLGDDSIKTKNTDAHNALADAFCQAKAVQAIYHQLGVKKKDVPGRS